VTSGSIIFLLINIFDYDATLRRLIGVLISEILFLIIFFYIILKNKKFKIYINLNFIKLALKASAPLVPSGILGLILALTDRRIIAIHYGLDEVANYSLALLMLAPIGMIMQSIQTIWAPNLFSINNINEIIEKTKKIIKVIFLLMMISALIISLTFYCLIEYKIVNKEYSSVPILIVYSSLGIIYANLVNFNSNIFLKLNLTKYQLLVNLLAVLINLILNIILIPEFSVYGAIAAMLICQIVQFYSGSLIIKKIILNKCRN
jgi:O-antigen/teichoic acid export membrane protein